MGKGHQLHYSLKLVWNNEAGRPMVRALIASLLLVERGGV